MNLKQLSADEVCTFMAEKFPDSGVEAPAPQPTQRRIVFGILSYDGRNMTRTTHSLIMAAFACAQEGWEISVCYRDGDSMVARGRNILVARFLKDPAATDLFFIDCDLEFSAEDFIRVCKHPVDVVAGAYPYKTDEGQFPLRWPSEGLYEENGLWVVNAATPGFLRITRQAAMKIIQEKPWLEFREKGLGPDGRAWNLFNNEVRANGVWDEGYTFGEHWRSVGGKVYLDYNCNITHIGLKSYNHGTINDWLNRTAANLGRLKAEFPHIPDLVLAPAAAKREIDYNAIDSKHLDKGKAGTAELHDKTDAPKHGPAQHYSPDMCGPGRPTDPGQPQEPAQGRPDKDIMPAEGGYPWAKKRSRLNGGSSGFISDWR